MLIDGPKCYVVAELNQDMGFRREERRKFKPSLQPISILASPASQWLSETQVEDTMKRSGSRCVSLFESPLMPK
jgi:hypothetical protein